jgi:hypothetical protein
MTSRARASTSPTTTTVIAEPTWVSANRAISAVRVRVATDSAVPITGRA